MIELFNILWKVWCILFQDLFEINIYIFNIINVLTVTFDSFNASLLNKRRHFLNK